MLHLQSTSIAPVIFQNCIKPPDGQKSNISNFEHMLHANHNRDIDTHKCMQCLLPMRTAWLCVSLQGMCPENGPLYNFTSILASLATHSPSTSCQQVQYLSTDPLWMLQPIVLMPFDAKSNVNVARNAYDPQGNPWFGKSLNSVDFPDWGHPHQVSTTCVSIPNLLSAGSGSHTVMTEDSSRHSKY